MRPRRRDGIGDLPPCSRFRSPTLAFQRRARPAQIGGVLDAAALVDAREDTIVAVPLDKAKGDPGIVLTYSGAETIRSATIFVPGAVPPFGDPQYRPVLEAEQGDGWRQVAVLPLTNVPTTVAFAPVIAARFRLRFARQRRAAETRPRSACAGCDCRGDLPDRAHDDNASGRHVPARIRRQGQPLRGQSRVRDCAGFSTHSPATRPISQASGPIKSSS